MKRYKSLYKEDKKELKESKIQLTKDRKLAWDEHLWKYAVAKYTVFKAIISGKHLTIMEVLDERKALQLLKNLQAIEKIAGYPIWKGSSRYYWDIGNEEVYLTTEEIVKYESKGVKLNFVKIK